MNTRRQRSRPVVPLACAVLAAALTAVACDPKDGGGADASALDVARDGASDQRPVPSDAPAGTGACNDLPRPPLLQPTVETAARPASQVETGGALQDGDYITTRVTIYSVPPPLTGAFGATMLGALMRVRAGVMESILLSDDGEGSGPVEQRTREAIKVEGNKLQLTLICPSGGGPEEGLYTTDGRTLRLSQVVDGIEIVFELARR
jgi:hypothetical protein